MKAQIISLGLPLLTMAFQNVSVVLRSTEKCEYWDVTEISYEKEAKLVTEVGNLQNTPLHVVR